MDTPCHNNIMRTSREEYPPRPRQSLPQQSSHLDTTMAIDGDLHQQQQYPPQAQHHHQLSPEMPPVVGGAQIFALFYSLIFSVVHAALTMVFTPVLGSSSREGRRRRPTSPAASERRVQSSPRSLSPRPRQSDGNNIMRESDDPELAMVEINSGIGGDGSAYHKPVPMTQSLTSASSRSSRSSSYVLSSVDENKAVRFSGQGRARPPLGRIERLSSSLSSTGSVGSTSSSSTSSSSSSSLSRTGGRSAERSTRPSPTLHSHHSISTTTSPSSPSRSLYSTSGPVKRTSSPFGRMTSPRMAHSTYFLE